MSNVNNTFGKLNVEGDLTINVHSRLVNTSVQGDTRLIIKEPDWIHHIDNSTFNGNLYVDDFLFTHPLRGKYTVSRLVDELIAIGSIEENNVLSHSIVKKDLQINVHNVLALKRLDEPNNAAGGMNFNSILRLAGYYRRVHLSPIRFIVEGNSYIKLGDSKYSNALDLSDIYEDSQITARSAIGLTAAGFGNVLALAEKYDEHRHNIEPYRSKIFFGEKSKIETQADYSHGLLLGGNFDSGAIQDGNQIYIENKGEIQVNGNASAISAYLYRLQSSNHHRHLLGYESKIIDDVEIIEYKHGNRSFVPTYQPDPNLQGERGEYIIPSALNNKAWLNQGDNLKQLLTRQGAEYQEISPNGLIHAKKNFDPYEKVVEINNTGKLLAPNGYIFSGSEFKDVFNSSGGKLAGKLVLNNGSDEVSLQNTDLEHLIELNGAEISGRQRELKKSVKMGYPQGQRTDVTFDNKFYYGIKHLLVSVDLPQAVNTLNLDQELTGSSTSAGQAGNTKIVNWDIINIGHNGLANLNLTGDLNDGWDGLTFEDNLRSKILNIGSQGLLSLANNQAEATVSYNVINAGSIDLSKNPNLSNGLTIDANYVGQNGKLLVNSQWNDPDSQQTDRLVIKGNASGRTIVEAPEGIKGNVTLNDKEIKNGDLTNPVVIIEGNNEGYFVGKAKTENAGEAQLVKTVTADGKTQYHWTLGLKDKHEIINKASTAYVQSQAVARELGFMTLGRLNQRLGELTNSSKPQTWLRTRFEDDILNGKNRFATKSQRYLVQIGQDVALWQDTEKLSRLGITFSHSKANTKFFDKYRAENGEVISDKFTTEAKLTALSLGGYFTQRYNNGAYVDFTGQLSHLKFNYLGEAQAKQKGYALGASVEVGYPIALNAIWDVEPQAQLSYQHIRLSAFSDAQQRQIAKQTSNNLRARLGVRFVANKQLYLGANLHYDLIGNQSKATIGRSYLAEKYGRLITELNFGGKIDLSENVSINIEAYYKKNLSKGHNAAQSNRDPSELGGQARLQVLF